MVEAVREARVVFVRVKRVLVGALVCVSVLALGACAPRAHIRSAWPVASVEATVAPSDKDLTYPLTGREAPGRASVDARPMLVKVADNASASGLLGVEGADVVYETENSAGHTILAALYQSGVPKSIAPVTQSGMPDVWICPQHGAALFSAGGPATLKASLARAGVLDLSADTTAEAAYRKVGSSLTLDGPAARDTLAAAGAQIAAQTPRLIFSQSVEGTTSVTTRVSVPFSANDVVAWSWDARSGRYLRTRNGRTATSGAGRPQIAADNVVVIWAHYTPVAPDVGGAGGFDVKLGGQGRVSVMRGGKRVDGQWKADGTTPPRFVTEDGATIPLAPGSTWIEVIPLATNITLH